MRCPFSPNFHVHKAFIQQADLLLSYLSFKDASIARNSPVLGLPLDLYRLILDIVTYFGSRTLNEDLDPLRIQVQVRFWERRLELVQNAEKGNALTGRPHIDLITLYILATSLLFDLMLLHHPDSITSKRGRNIEERQEHWQVARIFMMYKHPSDYTRWAKTYISLWPVLILGFAVKRQQDMMFLRQFLQDMRTSIGYGEAQRVQSELSGIWSSISNQDGLMESL